MKKEHAAYKKHRRTLAMTVGSEWAFFRNNDDDHKDKWAASPIRISSVSRDHKGRLHLFAVLIGNTHQKPRRVYYSELW